MQPIHIFDDILNTAGLQYHHNNVKIEGSDPVLPTPYMVGSLGAAALASVGYAASELWHLKTSRQQQIYIDARSAAIAQLSHQYVKLINGENKALWDPFSGFYQCKDKRFIQLHCNFPNHREGVINFLNCADNKEALTATILKWNAEELENSLNNLGLCASMVRSPDEWQQTGQAKVVNQLPLFEIIKIGESKPISLPVDTHMPLAGIKALDLTRVVAGPVCGRTMTEMGATVMRIDSPNLPYIYQLALDTGRGKLSAHLDLNKNHDKNQLIKLIRECDIFSQAYRPGGLSNLGFAPEDLTQMKPGIIYISLSAYSHQGPWQYKHGYDSLVQSATGIAYNGGGQPKHLPCQTLDYVAGFICAFGAMVALRKRAEEGGSYLVRTSLVQVATYLINLGLIEGFDKLSSPNYPDINQYLTQTRTPLGLIEHLKPALKLSETPLLANLPVVAIGSNQPSWP